MTIGWFLKLGAVLNVVVGFVYFGLMLLLGIGSGAGFLVGIALAAVPLAIASSAMTLRDELSRRRVVVEGGGSWILRRADID